MGKKGQTVTPSRKLQTKGKTFTLQVPVVQKVDNARRSQSNETEPKIDRTQSNPISRIAV